MPSNTGESGQLAKVHPRQNLLSRPDHRGNPKPFASNLTRVVLVLADKPGNEDLFIDQYYAAAHHLNCELTLFFNKVDQWDSTAKQTFARWRDTYERIGTQVFEGCAKDASTLRPLQASLADETAIFVGQSGAGKSSMIRQLVIERDIEVGDLTQHGQGAHTTTTARLYPSQDGGSIIDSPGVRDFRLELLEGVDASRSFTEFDQYLDECQFRNCIHLNEPRCGVKSAMAAGKIARSRYASYLSLCTNADC
ncbi:MAG: ribosome small subunit-dependent GTPase A [Gammaproteobacteria bacterium]|nr:ribosome small subunit-dependent GTPase A [Gammaproteobacteria bacterium]